MEKLHRLIIDKLPDFILGGWADFIVSEIGNTNHINFKVKQDPNRKDTYYVRYKSIDWKYIGYIKVKLNDPDRLTYKPLFFPCNKKDKMTDEMINIATIFKKLVLYIYHLNTLPSNIEVLYAGKCSRCGRELKDPKYIDIGIGPTCLKKS